MTKYLNQRNGLLTSCTPAVLSQTKRYFCKMTFLPSITLKVFLLLHAGSHNLPIVFHKRWQCCVVRWAGTRVCHHRKLIYVTTQRP